MKTASGCRSTNGCTPKYRDGFDGAAKMEAGPLKPTLPHSNDEDVRKSLRLNIWPFLSNAAKLRYSEVVHLNCTVAKTRRQSGRASARVFNPSAEIITGPNRSCPLMPQHVGTDNDYAVGQLVEGVSKSRFWGSTAIFILEDDAQNGPDHVDSHRSPAFVISPWVKRHAVDSSMYNTTSMLRTIEMILGLRPMTQFDAAAPPMSAVFQSTPDL